MVSRRYLVSSRGLDSEISRSWYQTWPTVGMSRPPIKFSSVVLPEPLGPNQYQQFAGIDLQIDVLEHFDRNFAHPICFANLVQMQQDLVGVERSWPSVDFCSAGKTH